MAERLIPRDKSVIVAADVELSKLDSLIKATYEVEGIGGYKIGFGLGLRSLKMVASLVRETTDLPIIYDHQKAGNDIPPMGAELVDVCKEAGINAVILFPFAGPATQEAWTKAAQDADLTVLVGGHMTHEKFLVSEGGYITDDAPERIYHLGATLGVRNFVVPGNKTDFVQRYRKLLEEILGPENFDLYAPGFITQGGSISETAQVAGKKWHAIVGSGIYKAEDMRKAAEQVTAQIR